MTEKLRQLLALGTCYTLCSVETGTCAAAQTSNRARSCPQLTVLLGICLSQLAVPCSRAAAGCEHSRWRAGSQVPGTLSAPCSSGNGMLEGINGGLEL